MSGTEESSLPVGLPTGGAPHAVGSAPARRETTHPPLTRAELGERLTLFSGELIAELWAITQKQLDAEIARHQRLDAKASSLLAAVGFALTVAVTFGSTLLTETQAFQDFYHLVVFTFGAAALAGLFAALFAMKALNLKRQGGVDENMVFDPSILQAADVDGSSDLQKEGVAEYRKSAIMHHWAVRQGYATSYDDKAAWVKWGQRAFTAFLVALLATSVLNMIAVAGKGDTKADANGKTCPPTLDSEQK